MQREEDGCRYQEQKSERAPKRMQSDRHALHTTLRQRTDAWLAARRLAIRCLSDPLFQPVWLCAPL